MDWTGVGVGAFGDILAIWALFQAGSAKRAVSRVMDKTDNQATRDEVGSLLVALKAAKDAALGRRLGASPLALQGRTDADDVHRLQLAQDALATATIGTDVNLASKIRKGASELNTALQTINSNSGQDGWADALAVLQSIIPAVQIVQRKLGRGGVE